MDYENSYIHIMNVRRFDLNLLLAFDALMTERHVSRAAGRIALSQPAMSNALARLRDLLDDPLLVRTTRGMEPTARALELREPIHAALRDIEHALAAPARFDPATAQRRFVIGASDYMEFLVLPELMREIQSEAPGIDIQVHSLQVTAPQEGLDTGELDLAFGYFPDLPKRLRRRPLFTEHLVCAVRTGHPTVQKTLTLEQFVALPHLFVATRSGSAGLVDKILAEQGLARRIAATVPHFLVAPFIIAQSDLIVTVNSRIARTFSRHLPLEVLEPPLALPDYPITLVWHPRHEKDPAGAWLRDKLVEVCKTVAAEPA